jgi:hypothetical protein
MRSVARMTVDLAPELPPVGIDLATSPDPEAQR